MAYSKAAMSVDKDGWLVIIRDHPWYRLGAEASKRVFPDVPCGYVCPLCGDLYPPESADDGLTREHALPEALGGHRLVLTCGRCNNRAGTELDHHAVTNESIRHLLDGTMTGNSSPIRARMHLESRYSIEADLVNPGKGIVPASVPRLLGPPLPDTTSIELRGFTGKWKFRTGHATRSMVSWLRSAYLVAFAAFGYRYILLPGLGQVRKWVQEPESAEGQIYYLDLDLEHISQDRRNLMVIPANGPVESIAVQFGKRIMFLPGTQQGETFYKRLSTGEHRTWLLGTVGKQIDWPTGPQHLLDHSEQQSSENPREDK